MSTDASPIKTYTQSEINRVVNRKQISSYSRENGILSIEFEKRHAFSLNKVKV